MPIYTHYAALSDVSVIPFLEEAYCSHQDAEVRALLVEIIWMHRQWDSIPFLSKALNDPHEVVWKTALDGLVAKNTNEAKHVVFEAISRSTRDLKLNDDFYEYAIEALEQMNGSGLPLES
ncbi:MAG: hypothetical protein HJJLKODD_02060 [Phycisphaerae bacterium]|nr:hypothetical protein [Phycisphaerae bacterium]